MIILLTILLLLALLYAFLVRGRSGQKGLGALQGWAYAHRGLHNKPSIPENSMSAFRKAIEKGYGAELDVHLLKDGSLAVFHDASLERCTGSEGFIEDLTREELKNYHLEGTDETIPTFEEVLALFEGKAPLIIELKAERGNAAALSEAVCKVLDNYKGIYCIESFDPRCLIWLKKNRPEIIRGQLSMNFLKHSAKMGKMVDIILTFLLQNVVTRPDFIAYCFDDRKNLSNQLCLNLWSVQGVSWTITTQEQFESCMMENLLPIFEQFEPELFPEE